MLLPGESAQVLLADSLVDGGATADSLPVVVRRVRPPVGLHLHVPKSTNSLSIDRHSSAMCNYSIFWLDPSHSQYMELEIGYSEKKDRYATTEGIRYLRYRYSAE
jgi:hypothetical protein